MVFDLVIGNSEDSEPVELSSGDSLEVQGKIRVDYILHAHYWIWFSNWLSGNQ